MAEFYACCTYIEYPKPLYIHKGISLALLYINFPYKFFWANFFLRRSFKYAWKDLEYAYTDDIHHVYITIILLSQFIDIVMVFIALFSAPIT